MKTWKLLAVLVLSAAFFVTGYQHAAALYGEDVAALREDYATRSQALEEKYREKERVQYMSLVAAWQERDAALARADSLAGDVERVRKQAADAKRRLSAAAGGPASLKESSLPAAQALSSEAQSWFDEVSSFLSGLR